MTHQAASPATSTEQASHRRAASDTNHGPTPAREGDQGDHDGRRIEADDRGQAHDGDPHLVHADLETGERRRTIREQHGAEDRGRHHDPDQGLQDVGQPRQGLKLDHLPDHGRRGLVRGHASSDHRAERKRSISAPTNNDGATDTTPQAQTCNGLRFVNLKPEARASPMENAVVMMRSSTASSTLNSGRFATLPQ